MNKLYRYCAALLCIMHYALCIGTEVKSPNGNIVLNFTVENGRPTYSLSYKGKEVA